MHSGLSLPTSSRHSRQHMMQPCGAPCRLAWAPPQRTRHAPLGTSPSSRPALADWDCRRPRAPAQRLTGRAGPMPSPCSANGPWPFRIGLSAASLTLVGQPAYEQPLNTAACLWLNVPSGSSWCREPARLTDVKGSPSPVNGGMGWQHCASRTRNLFFRDHVLLPSLPPSHRALLRSQAGPHAAAWLQAIPSDPHTSLTAETMLIALRRRLRLQLPLAPGRCGSTAEPGCGRSTDAFWRPCTCVPSIWPPGKAGQTCGAGLVQGCP